MMQDCAGDHRRRTILICSLVFHCHARWQSINDQKMIRLFAAAFNEHRTSWLMQQCSRLCCKPHLAQLRVLNRMNSAVQTVFRSGYFLFFVGSLVSLRPPPPLLILLVSPLLATDCLPPGALCAGRRNAPGNGSGPSGIIL
jgi:hypothetical protein